MTSSHTDVSPLDLLRLARAEFRRYDEFASAGAYQMFPSARLASQLVEEAIDRIERQDEQVLNDSKQESLTWPQIEKLVESEKARMRAVLKNLERGYFTSDAELGMAWFNSLTERERGEWLRRANSAVPADAWAAFKAQRSGEQFSMTEPCLSGSHPARE